MFAWVSVSVCVCVLIIMVNQIRIIISSFLHNRTTPFAAFLALCTCARYLHCPRSRSRTRHPRHKPPVRPCARTHTRTHVKVLSEHVCTCNHTMWFAVVSWASHWQCDNENIFTRTHIYCIYRRMYVCMYVYDFIVFFGPFGSASLRFWLLLKSSSRFSAATVAPRRAASLSSLRFSCIWRRLCRL